MKITKWYHKAGNIGKAVVQKQKEISVSEVWHIQGHLSMRYKVLENTNILKNFAQDPDLNVILDQGVKVLQEQIKTLDGMMKEYGIPFPIKPPYESKSNADIEIFTDRYIFRRILMGIQSFIPIHATAFTQSTLPEIREQFKSFLLQEIDLFDKLVEYGKLKGFEVMPPKYRN